MLIKRTKMHGLYSKDFDEQSNCRQRFRTTSHSAASTFAKLYSSFYCLVNTTEFQILPSRPHAPWSKSLIFIHILMRHFNLENNANQIPILIQGATSIWDSRVRKVLEKEVSDISVLLVPKEERWSYILFGFFFAISAIVLA